MYTLNEQQVYRHLAGDRVMDSMIREVREAGPFSFPVPTLNVYRGLLEAVVYQQVSIRAAKSIFERFQLSLGEAIDNPSTLVEMDLADLRSFGISGRKASCMQRIAQLFCTQPALGEKLTGMPDEAVAETLIRVKGIGIWTVKMILMFSLGRPDVFPVEDLGIRQAISARYAISGNVSEMHEIATAWKPYRTFASHLLWRWKRIGMGIDY